VRLRLGISPCPNDTFAFHAIMHGAVDLRGLEFDIELRDVQALNEGLAAGRYDIAKASFHAALLLADFILGERRHKVKEQYEYGNPTKDYGFKRWYPEQGLSAEQIDKLEERWRSTLRDLTRRSSF